MKRPHHLSTARAELAARLSIPRPDRRARVLATARLASFGFRDRKGRPLDLSLTELAEARARACGMGKDSGPELLSEAWERTIGKWGVDLGAAAYGPEVPLARVARTAAAALRYAAMEHARSRGELSFADLEAEREDGFRAHHRMAVECWQAQSARLSADLSAEAVHRWAARRGPETQRRVAAAAAGWGLERTAAELGCPVWQVRKDWATARRVADRASE